jgi:hypothetical protein
LEFWEILSGNPNAIHLLEQNLGKVDWDELSANPNAIHLLEQNPFFFVALIKIEMKNPVRKRLANQ